MITNPLIEQGIQQGESTGLRRGLQRSILHILSHRFSQVPAEIRSRIVALEETDQLERLLDAALEVDSLQTLANNGLLGTPVDSVLQKSPT